MRALALITVAAVLLAACSPLGGGGSVAASLARDQSFEIFEFSRGSVPSTLDPADVQGSQEVELEQQVFQTLYERDSLGRLQPIIASGAPEISADGLTYTIPLRGNVRFSNGDHVTAADVLYSWNRSANHRAVYGPHLVWPAVKGGAEVLSGVAPTLTGVAAPDDHTIRVTLVRPAGYFQTLISQPTAAIVDHRSVERFGDKVWWSQPDGLVGSGPFRMTAYNQAEFAEFAPVPRWWKGPTGHLTRVRVDFTLDQATSVQMMKAGELDVTAIFDGQTLNRVSADTQVSLVSRPGSTWLWRFNLDTGPFAGVEAGRPGRHAFSTAINRAQLVQVACGSDILCVPATGGLISKGLQGYLGDGQDVGARFDPAAARAEYRSWDPDGTKVAGLELVYVGKEKEAQDVQAQLKANLGVSLALRKSTLGGDGRAPSWSFFESAWVADYDHPQNWFDTLVTCDAAAVYAGCDPRVDALVLRADALPLDKALPLYVQAGTLYADDVGTLNIYYRQPVWAVQPWVRGFAARGQDFPRWSDIWIAQH